MSAAYPNPPLPKSEKLNPPRPAKFTAEFLERRMAAHQLWQRRQAEAYLLEAIGEVMDLSGPKPNKVAAWLTRTGLVVEA